MRPTQSHPTRFAKRVAITLAAAAVGIGGALLAPAAPASAATVDVTPGMEIKIAGSGGGSLCTLAFTATKAGKQVGFTAGHCGKVGEKVYNGENGNVHIGTFTMSKAPATGIGGQILDANAPDWAVIEFTASANVKAASANVKPKSVGTAKVGDEVCAQGRTTGWRCGKVTNVNSSWITTDIYRDRGDSGGPLIRTSDNAALGILSSIEVRLGAFGGLLQTLDTGSLGGNGGGTGGRTSRFYVLSAAVSASNGAELNFAGEESARGSAQTRTAPAPTDASPAPLPQLTVA